MRVRFLGAHNTESRTTRHTCLLIDDCLALDAGGLTSQLSFRRQTQLKAVLLTHGHYDHIRDVGALAMNLYLRQRSIDIFSTQPVFNTLKTNFLNGETYPNFFERPPEKPTIRFTVMAPFQTVQIGDYVVEAVPMNHSVPTVGYRISGPGGATVFYTGDTGPGLYESWRHVSPHLLVIEVTASNRFNEFANTHGHLTPDLLKQELTTFRQLKGYLPDVAVVHTSPSIESEIAGQLETVAEDLDANIFRAREGREIDIQSP